MGEKNRRGQDDERKDGWKKGDCDLVKRRRRTEEGTQRTKTREEVADRLESNKDKRAAQKGVMILIPRCCPR